MNKFFRLVLLFALLLTTAVLTATEPVLRSETIAAVHIDAAKIFNFYAAQAKEMVKPENADKLAELEKQFKGFARLDTNISDFFKKIDDFAGKELFLPDGQLSFSIDSSLRPNLSFKAKVKPLAFLEFVESFTGRITPHPTKREQNLVEFVLPTPGHQILLSIRPEGLFMQTENAPAESDPQSSGKWADFLSRIADKNTLIAAEIDLNGIKHMVAGKTANTQHGVCFTNLRMLTAAIEMHSMDKEATIKTLDQKQLIGEHYLNSELICPNQGNYSLLPDGEVSCSSHGTIKQPATLNSDKVSEAEVPAPYRPFENFRLLIKNDQAAAELALNDKNLAEQWSAIGKQQLLAIKNMAQNQMGQLPESERQKGMKMLDAIKISHEENKLRVAVEGLDEKTMLSGMTGIVGAAAAIALPGIEKARNLAQQNACRANCRLLMTAIEMYELDTSKAMQTLDSKALEDGKYIKKQPVCPEDGTYRLERDSSGISVKCSVHGF